MNETAGAFAVINELQQVAAVWR